MQPSSGYNPINSEENEILLAEETTRLQSKIKKEINNSQKQVTNQSARQIKGRPATGAAVISVIKNYDELNELLQNQCLQFRVTM